MALTKFIQEKLNPSQPSISGGGMSEASTSNTILYQQCYEQIEIVNRAVNMIVDDVAEIPVIVQPPTIDKYKPYQHSSDKAKTVKVSQLSRLLNFEPNPFQDALTFKRNLIIDLIIDGNIFIYFDGRHLFHLPATDVVLETDEVTFINKYTYSSRENYSPDEIIHIKDNSLRSIFRGTSRLKAAYRTIQLIDSMRKFQINFFKNGAVPGLTLSTENTLSSKIKEKLTEEWRNKYRPESGGRRPLILDGGLKVEKITSDTIRDLDFKSAIENCEESVLKSLGIPPLLINGGNNANIRPNHRLYYLETVLPIVKKLNKGYEKFFGYIVREDVTQIQAMQPELREFSTYLVSLKNSGIISANEARGEIGKEARESEHDRLIAPANIAGSAVNPTEGGRPTEEEED